MIYLKETETEFKLPVIHPLNGVFQIELKNNQTNEIQTLEVSIATLGNVATVTSAGTVNTGIYTYKLEQYTGLLQVGNYNPINIQYNNNKTNTIYNG